MLALTNNVLTQAALLKRTVIRHQPVDVTPNGVRVVEEFAHLRHGHGLILLAEFNNQSLQDVGSALHGTGRRLLHDGFLFGPRGGLGRSDLAFLDNLPSMKDSGTRSQLNRIDQRTVVNRKGMAIHDTVEVAGRVFTQKNLQRFLGRIPDVLDTSKSTIQNFRALVKRTANQLDRGASGVAATKGVEKLPSIRVIG